MLISAFYATFKSRYWLNNYSELQFSYVQLSKLFKINWFIPTLDKSEIALKVILLRLPTKIPKFGQNHGNSKLFLDFWQYKVSTEETFMTSSGTAKFSAYRMLYFGMCTTKSKKEKVHRDLPA